MISRWRSETTWKGTGDLLSEENDRNSFSKIMVLHYDTGVLEDHGESRGRKRRGQVTVNKVSTSCEHPPHHPWFVCPIELIVGKIIRSENEAMVMWCILSGLLRALTSIGAGISSSTEYRA